MWLPFRRCSDRSRQRGERSSGRESAPTGRGAADARLDIPSLALQTQARERRFLELRAQQTTVLRGRFYTQYFLVTRATGLCGEEERPDGHNESGLETLNQRENHGIL